MKVIAVFLFIAAFGFSLRALAQQQPAVTVSVLAIGNQYYNRDTDFRLVEGVNESAEEFLSCFKAFCTPCILLSSQEKPLSKSRILNAIASFITYVEKQRGTQNIGIIYYCGHGISSKAGSRYFVPGNINISVFDTTYEALTEKLINLDSIKSLVINAQTDSSRSQFILMGDCCSNQDISKWYSGITYSYINDSSGMLIRVNYNDTAIKNALSGPSILGNSATMTFDDLNDTTQQKNTTKGTDEMVSMGEIIRSMTFKKRMNHVLYSSPIGGKTAMVRHPFSKDPNETIAPICRRTLLYFKGRPLGKQNLGEYFQKLTDVKFDSSPPVLLDPTMNAGNGNGLLQQH